MKFIQPQHNVSLDKRRDEIVMILKKQKYPEVDREIEINSVANP